MRTVVLVAFGLLWGSCGSSISQTSQQPTGTLSQPARRFCKTPPVDGTWCEDFFDVREGDLPASWGGGDGLGVKPAGSRKVLTPFEDRREYLVSIPGWRVSGDFGIDWVITTRKGNEQFNGSVTLPNTDPVSYSLRFGTLEVDLTTAWGGGWPSSIRLGESSAKLPDLANAVVHLSMSRRGRVYAISINGKQVLTARYDATDVDGLTIAVSNAGRRFGINAITLYVPDAGRTGPAGRAAAQREPDCQASLGGHEIPCTPPLRATNPADDSRDETGGTGTLEGMGK